MVVFFLVPAAMGYEVLGRHTPLASMGFSILLIAVLRLITGSRPFFLPALLIALLGVLLTACQGLAWSQTVSCRMNHAVLETLRQERAALVKADRVVIDQHSFAQKIPSSYREAPDLHLDTYWGVDGLLGENFRGLVHYVSGRRIPVEILRSSLRPEEQGRISREGTVWIDYAAVYPQGFHSGRRGPSR